MDIFHGLRDRYDALKGAFHRDDKKDIDRLGSRESEGYRGQIERNGSICSRRKVENYQERGARRRPDPQRFLENSQLAVWCWLCHSQKAKEIL